MIRNSSRIKRSRKNESVEDPHELLLSLVDMGSIDTEEALIACVSEMSDAECKRILNSLTLPAAAEEVEDDMAMDDDMVIDVDEEPEDYEDDDESEEPEEDDDSEDEDSDEGEAEEGVDLESRLRNLERRIHSNESRIRNRRARH